MKSESTSLSKAYIKSKGKGSRCEGLRALDAFGVPIHLYYEGSSEYRTKVGAVITLFLYVFLLYVTHIAVWRIYKSANPTISTWYQPEKNNRFDL